ncbi:hypothetical protein Lesp02_20990 [Lentzea sp. NBRC 105346]|uniref:hypothetical protein n=1 Tax=Lentzea sp. NBRC 105346 TaxID=3032205 RepID=UPI0024A4E241|nr:hypothetical protein [Lentzea sp. NBRC 105346]GLZ29909.1 hypothetical protein Lesp02_20990 [Lentzea sp. NBRC 105346]
MENRGPLLTLLVVAALAAVVLGINMSREATPASAPGPATLSAAPTTTTTTTTTTKAPFEEMYVGKVDTGAAIAVAVKNEKAVAYLCDGQQVESWLEGTLQESTLSLKAKNGDELTGTIQGDQLSGTVIKHGFTAANVDPPAGLFRASAGVLDRVGWIVEKDGTVTGLRLKDGAVQQAPAFSPDKVTIDGKDVPVERVAP